MTTASPADAGQPPPGAAILLIQSGPKELALAAQERLRQARPSARLTILVQRDEDFWPAEADVELLRNPGPSPAFLRLLRARRFDEVYVLWTGAGDHWKLKLLPLALAPCSAFAIDERLELLPLSPGALPGLARHFRERLDDPPRLRAEVARAWKTGLDALALPALLATFWGRSRGR